MNIAQKTATAVVWFGISLAAQAHTVTAGWLNVRGGPGFGYRVTGGLRRGTVVNVTGRSGSWSHISSPRSGWCFSAYLANTPHNSGGGPAPAPARIILNVPIIRQLPELPTGCEITSVTMMLRYRGAWVTKTGLANEMPRSSNPDYGFVGNPYTSSGWTIYPPALMGLVRKYAGSAVNLTGGGIAALQSQIRRNRPVVVWVTMHGFSVHALTVTGFDSTGIYYNDCWTGQKNARLSNSAFYWTWNTHARRAISY